MSGTSCHDIGRIDVCWVLQLGNTDHALGQSGPQPSLGQSKVEITAGVTVQEAQGYEAQESISSDDDGGSVSVSTFSLKSYMEEEILLLKDQLFNTERLLQDNKQHLQGPVLQYFQFRGWATSIPSGWCLSHCKWKEVWKTQAM